jgi:tetratricopeptide (TPR) repeat protein
MTAASSAPRTLASILGVSFVAALLLRLAYVLAFRGSPFFDHLIVDAQWHDEWAWAWARDQWNPAGHAFFRAPLYPLWLSVLYRLFGHDLLAVRLVQAVLGAGTAAAVGGAGYRLGGRGTGYAAGLLAAGYGTLIFFDGELLIPNLLLALLSWALFFLLGSRTWRHALLAGALLGLAAVARPNVLMLIPVAALWVVFAREDAGSAPDVGPSRPHRWARGAAVVGLGLLPALVVTGINARQEGAAVFISSQGGVNFYAGNHALASGRSVQIPELTNLTSWRDFVDQAEATAQRDVGRRLDSGEVSNWWLRRGLRWLRAHPGDAARLYLRKAYYLVNGFETPSNRDVYFDPRGPLRALLWKIPFLAVPWGLVFPLAAAGCVLGWRDRRLGAKVRLLAAWSGLYAVSLLPFFINARFRLALAPPVVILAALALSRPRRALVRWPLAAALVVFAVANSNFAGARVENPAQELSRLGDILVRDGRLAEGLDALERAHRLEPASVATATLLAELYARLDRPEDALPLYEFAAGQRPEDADVRFNMAVEYLKLERYEQASQVLETVVRLRPDFAEAWINLGAAYEGRGRIPEAEAAYRRGIDLAPLETLGTLRLAGMFLERGNADQAVTELEAAVDRIRTSFELRYQLALAYAAAGRLEPAREQADIADRLNPQNEEIRRLQAWLESRR